MPENSEITVRVMPEIEDRIIELSGKLEAIMVERAPEAWALALDVVRMQGLTNLVLAAVFGGMLVLTYFFTRRAWSLAEETSNYFQGEARFFTCLGSVIFGGGSIFGLVLHLLPWTWAALFAPELVIARRVMAGLL